MSTHDIQHEPAPESRDAHHCGHRTGHHGTEHHYGHHAAHHGGQHCGHHAGHHDADHLHDDHRPVGRGVHPARACDQPIAHRGHPFGDHSFGSPSGGHLHRGGPSGHHRFRRHPSGRRSFGGHLPGGHSFGDHPLDGPSADRGDPLREHAFDGHPFGQGVGPTRAAEDVRGEPTTRSARGRQRRLDRRILRTARIVAVAEHRAGREAVERTIAATVSDADHEATMRTLRTIARAVRAEHLPQRGHGTRHRD